jgi:hypothetical protein
MDKYRIERLVAGNDGVTLFEATELSNGRVVQLSVYRSGSTMLDIAQIDSGMLVVVDARSKAAPPRLELVDVTSDEDAFFDEPPAPELFDDVPLAGPRRLWPWVLAAIASLGIGAGAWYVARVRPVATGEATITEAVIPARTIEATAPAPPTPTAVQPRVTEQRPAPAPKRPQPPRRAPHVTPKPPSDPLTL